MSLGAWGGNDRDCLGNPQGVPLLTPSARTASVTTYAARHGNLHSAPSSRLLVIKQIIKDGFTMSRDAMWCIANVVLTPFFKLYDIPCHFELVYVVCFCCLRWYVKSILYFRNILSMSNTKYITLLKMTHFHQIAGSASKT